MNPISIFILGILLGGGAGWLLGWRTRLRSSSFGATKEDDETLINRQAKEKEENKQRILGILENRSPLTNNMVEQLLGISDATAERYLQELETEGKVRQIGKTGKHVYYEKA